jgi:hypothetical protein
VRLYAPAVLAAEADGRDAARDAIRASRGR